MIYLKSVTNKLDKYIEYINERKYKKLVTKVLKNIILKSVSKKH